MHQYKVVKAYVNEADEVMNRWARDGWRVVAVSPNIATGMGIIITLEKEAEDR